MIKKAAPGGEKLRLGIIGQSGTGKTWSSLLVREWLGYKKVCIIDTDPGVSEGKSASERYGDHFDFDVCVPEAPHTGRNLLKALKEVEANEYDLIIVDSLSDEWSEAFTHVTKKGGHAARQWGIYKNDQHIPFIMALQHSPAHIICTMKPKEVEQEIINEDGEVVETIKIVTARQEKDSVFRFTTVVQLFHNHTFTVVKDRSQKFKAMQKPIKFNEENFGAPMREFLNEFGCEEDKVDLGAKATKMKVAINKATSSTIEKVADKLKELKKELTEEEVIFLESLLENKKQGLDSSF